MHAVAAAASPAAATPPSADPDVISKAEFARRRGVTPGRVSQWLSEGKVDGAALVGEGRQARIRESIAVAQLNARLDLGQRFGNGLATRLELQPPAQNSGGQPAGEGLQAGVEISPRGEGGELPLAAPAATAVDTTEKKIVRAKLEQLERANRIAAEEEAARAGLLVDAEGAARQYGKLAAQLVTVFEGALSDFAAAIAAKWQVPQRDVTHLLRGEFRRVRASAAETLRRAVENMPATVEHEIGADESDDGADDVHPDQQCAALGA